MKKMLFIFTILLFYSNCFAQISNDEDYVGYVKSINLPNKRIRFVFPLVYTTNIISQNWISKNKVKKVAYFFNDKLEHESSYTENGDLIQSKSGDGIITTTVYKKTTDGVEKVLTRIYNERNTETQYEKKNNKGQYVNLKKMFNGGLANNLMIFYNDDDKIIKTIRYNGDKLVAESEFEYTNKLINSYKLFDYNITTNNSLSEDTKYKYDENNNCILIETNSYFGQKKLVYNFDYENGLLIKETSKINEGNLVLINEIFYEYDSEKRLVEVIEVNDLKKSIIKILYNKAGKIETLLITGDRLASSSFFPLQLYTENAIQKIEVSYDDRNNLVDYKTFINGELRNKEHYDIEYY